MSNPRKGKITYTLWLSKEEERILLENLKHGLPCAIGLKIQEKFKEGDFLK